MSIEVENHRVSGAAGALDAVVDLSGEMAMLVARRARTVHALHRAELDQAARDGREITSVVERGIRLELAAALRMTEYSADKLLTFADGIVDRYPIVLESLENVRMTEVHAEILVDSIDKLEPELRARILQPGVDLAESEPVGTFRRKLRDLIETVRSSTLTERHERALDERRIAVELAEDGMAWLHALVPAVEAHAIHSRLTQMAKSIIAPATGEGAPTVPLDDQGDDPDPRTLDQARADIFCDLLIDGRTPTHPRAARGIRATVTVTVPALSLMAVDDVERDERGLAPARIEGLGPIPLQRAKELCAGDAGWMRILTHPETGMALSIGRDEYRPPPALRKLVRWRADRCMAPGCHMPASRCEIDHTLAWEDGGTTSLENLNPLCKGHHRVKHHGGWTVTAVPDSGGALHWRSPTGREYTVQPERRMPVFRPSDESAVGAPF